MDTQGKSRLVAIVDDDDSIRSALQGLLRSAELPAQSFASAEEFLKSGQQHQIACLIADIRMPGMSGLELQAHLNAERCKIPIIFITAFFFSSRRRHTRLQGDWSSDVCSSD